MSEEPSRSVTPDAAPHSAHHHPSVEEQLAEVYALVDELHLLTDRIRSKVDNVLSTFSGGESG